MEIKLEDIHDLLVDAERLLDEVRNYPTSTAAVDALNVCIARITLTVYENQ